VYHVELRQFPHNMCRFNLSEQQLLALATPWANEQWVEFGERKWNVNEAKMTILEGPKMAMSQLTMGRGWRSAQRKCEDVTERVLESLERLPGASGESEPSQAAAQPPVAESTWEGGGQAAASPPKAPPADRLLLADSLGLEILAILDRGPVTPSRLWRLAHLRLGEGLASESLALAEQALRSLLERGLVRLSSLSAGGDSGEPGAPAGKDLPEEHFGAALSAPESWMQDARPALLEIRRA
jgi:hypothetical protein